MTRLLSTGHSYGVAKWINDSRAIDRSLLRSCGVQIELACYPQVTPRSCGVQIKLACYRQVTPTELRNGSMTRPLSTGHLLRSCGVQIRLAVYRQDISNGVAACKSNSRAIQVVHPGIGSPMLISPRLPCCTINQSAGGDGGSLLLERKLQLLVRAQNHIKCLSQS
jgi:hypothetical protein